MQLSDGMEPVGVVSKFPGKIGMQGGASVGSDSSLTTRNSYMTQGASVLDEVDMGCEMEMDNQPPAGDIACIWNPQWVSKAERGECLSLWQWA
jgi:hypothetical protein